MTRAAKIAAAFVAACRTELDALKPGNVHRFAEGHGMTVADFERSADVSADPIARPGAGVGARVLEAVEATRAAVGQNTNLGILLLAAPLAVAAEGPEQDLRAALARVLASLDREDARGVFAAIAAANPGGLGTAERNDVRAPPAVPLLEAMAEAAARDLIARQYVTNFDDIFDLGLSTYRAARADGSDAAEAATAVYLAFLAAEPDSHVARKFGLEAAESLRREAAARSKSLGRGADRIAALSAWDAAWKARGLNPGTSADLTVATIFAAGVASVRDEWLATASQQ